MKSYFVYFVVIAVVAPLQPGEYTAEVVHRRVLDERTPEDGHADRVKPQLQQHVDVGRVVQVVKTRRAVKTLATSFLDRGRRG